MCLFLVLLMRNANGMATFQLALPQDDKETMNRGIFFSPLGGTSLKYPEVRQNDKTIMDDVRIYYNIVSSIFHHLLLELEL